MLPISKIPIIKAEGSPNVMESTEIVNNAIDETPAAKPSKPSIKLMALVIPTIQNKVIGIANHPNSITFPSGIVIYSICKPDNIGIKAAMICHENFAFADKVNKSSKTPINIIIVAPIKIGRSFGKSGKKTRTPTIKLM